MPDGDRPQVADRCASELAERGAELILEYVDQMRRAGFAQGTKASQECLAGERRACAACDGTRRIDTRSDTAVGDESRLSADFLRDCRQDVDRRRQGVDLAPTVVGDMETVDAERNGAFGVCGMKHAFQKQRAFPDIPVSCDFVLGKSTSTFPANELGGFL